ncbi:MAG: CoA pyrophosphatase [Pirellulaceae bacterium]
MIPPRLVNDPKDPEARWIAELAARLKLQTPPDFRPPSSPQLSYGRHQGPPQFNARQAAVLLCCMVDSQGEWSIPLVVRAEQHGHHAGQIAFPGGKLDPGETPREAALREFFEEMGVSVESDEVVGQLPPTFVFASNFQVHSFVAVTTRPVAWYPSQDEVAQVLELPLLRLFDPAAYGQHPITRRGLQFSAPHLEFQGHYIWGATLRILGQLAQCLCAEIKIIQR